MKNALLGAALAVFLAGCSNSNDNSITAEKNESGEGENFGSATDIAYGDGSKRSTNELNVADDGRGGPPNREAGNYQAQPIAGQSSDEELAKKVKVALTTGSQGTTGVIAENQLTSIEVQVQNGVVTLSGPVTSEKEKETIGKQVAGMKGVQGVQNNLTPGGRSVEDKPLQPLVPRTEGNQ